MKCSSPDRDTRVRRVVKREREGEWQRPLVRVVPPALGGAGRREHALSKILFRVIGCSGVGGAWMSERNRPSASVGDVAQVSARSIAGEP